MALDPRSCMYRCDQPERRDALVPPLKDRVVFRAALWTSKFIYMLLCGPEIPWQMRARDQAQAPCGGLSWAFYVVDSAEI